ncbi:MAG: cohesin domain-containing protein [bacterium]
MEKKLVVISLILVAFSVSPATAGATTLYLAPQSQNIYQGDSFLVEIRIDTAGEDINAVEANLNFPAELLQAVDISNGSSIFNLWAKVPTEDSTGKISFIGGVSKGFKGDGLLAKISFLAKQSGQAIINFKEDSKVLLNDGQGSESPTNFLAGDYMIITKPAGLPIVSSGSHLDQNKWYNKNTLQLYWDLTNETEYSYLLSFDPLAKPDNNPDKPAGELVWVGALEYKGLDDGIYYFTLKQKPAAKDWSEIVRFKAMIDNTLPEVFIPQIGNSPAIMDGQHFLSFNATDETSGIDYYEVKEQPRLLGIAQSGTWQKAESPYLLTDQSLRSIIKVRAVDKAGNERIVEIISPYKPTVRDILLLISLFAVGILIWIFVRRIRRRKQNKNNANQK